MERNYEQVGEHVVIILCRLLKEKEGIYYSKMAKDMGVDCTLLCKWLKNKVSIMPRYYEQIKNYFKTDTFGYLKDDLIDGLMEDFHIQPSGNLIWFMRQLSYTVLIDYLFDYLTIAEIERENKVRRHYLELVKETLLRKTMDGLSEVCCQPVVNVLDQYPDDVREELNKMNINAANTLVMDIAVKGKGWKRCVLLFYDYNQTCVTMDPTEMINTLAFNQPFGKIDYIMLLKIPKNNKCYIRSDIERVLDFTARKIIKILEQEKIKGCNRM